MSPGGTQGSPAAARPNAVAVARRQHKGWSQRRLAVEFQIVGKQLGLAVPDSLDSIIKQISRVERGLTVLPEGMYLRVWCAALDTEPAELFGHLDAPIMADGDSSTFVVTSHKFIPVHLGCESAATMQADPNPPGGQWLECRRAALSHPGGQADVYVWPFGTAVFHVREKVRLTSLADLAVWRRRSSCPPRTGDDFYERYARA